MFFYGMIGFPAAAGVAVWSLSLARRAAARPRFSSVHAALPASLAVLLPLHVQGFAIFAGVGLCAGLLLLISSSLSPAEGTAEGRRGRAKGAPVTGGHAAAGRAAAERVGAGRAGAGRAAARREATGHEAIGRVAIGRVAIGRLGVVRLFLFVLFS